MRHQVIALAVAAALAVVSAAAHADADTSVGGKLFVDFTNIDQTKGGADTAAAGTGLDVKRGYLIIDHKFDDFWSANLTTDFNYSASTGETQLFVKKAYVQAKWAPEFAVRAGSDEQPWIPFVEGLTGMRYIEQTLVDRSKFGNSADWGVRALGTGGDGFFNYNVAAVNGGGYKNPTRSDNVDLEARVGIQPIPGLMIAAGGYSGERGQDLANLPATTTTRTASRGDFLVAYNNSNVRVGGEYFTADNYNSVLSTSKKDSSDGYSAWGWVQLAPGWAAVGRYDHFQPTKDTDNAQKDTYYYGGVEWAARKGIKLSAVFKHEKLDDFPLSNVVKTNEIGVWAEIAF